MFPKMFPIALRFYHTCFGKSWTFMFLKEGQREVFASVGECPLFQNKNGDGQIKVAPSQKNFNKKYQYLHPAC